MCWSCGQSKPIKPNAGTGRGGTYSGRTVKTVTNRPKVRIKIAKKGR